MTDIQCAMGLAQLKKFDKLVDKKNTTHKLYTKHFSDFEHVEIFQPPKEVKPFVPFRVILKTRNNEAENLMEHMRTHGVEPRMFFYPLHLQPAFECWSDDPRHDRNNFPMSEDLYNNGVCLPSFVMITEQQVEYVCGVIKNYYENK